MAASTNVNIALVTLCYVFVHFVDSDQCVVKGTTLTCATAVGEQTVNVEMVFKLCQRKPLVSIKIVDERGFHFLKEYIAEEGQEADIKIDVRQGWEIETVELKMKSRGHGKEHISVTGLVVYSGLVEEEDCSDLEYWFNSQSLVTLRAIGSALVITVTAFGSYCILAFCRQRKRRAKQRAVITEGGSPLTPVGNSNVPYGRLENNEDDLAAILPSRDWLSRFDNQMAQQMERNNNVLANTT